MGTPSEYQLTQLKVIKRFVAPIVGSRCTKLLYKN